MQNFLAFVVIVLLGFAGFEYYQHTQEVTAYIQQRDSLADNIAQLKKTNKALKDDQVGMTEKLSNLQKEAVDLQAEISSMPSTNAPAATTPAP